MIFGAPTIVTNGLALYLDAGNSISYISGSTTWTDMAQKGSTTLVNTPTFTNSTGSFALTFNGTNQYGTIPAVALGTAYTIEIWVNLANLTSRVWLCDGANNYTMNFLNGSIYAFGATVIITPSPLIVANQWYHVACTKSSTVFNAYVNGVFKGSDTVTAGSTFSIGVIGALTSNLSTFSNYAAGKLTQVRGYTRALSAQEIAQNYNATKTRFGLL